MSTAEKVLVLNDYPPRILIVGDEVISREILARKLTAQGYSCESCTNGQEAIDLLAGGKFDLVLADISMPEIGGGALLKEAMRVSPGIAVILVTSVIDIELAVDSLKDGAYDYITKPFSLEQVSISVSRALEKRRLLFENQNYQRTLEEQVASRTRQLEEALRVLKHTYRSTLVALSKVLDSRDADSDGHSLRVTVYTRQLAQGLNLSEPEIRVIEQGVLLHDIGKIGIPDELLRNPGNWAGTEYIQMRRHPEIGYRILSSIKFLRKAAQVVLHHHERYDGNGYPPVLAFAAVDAVGRGVVALVTLQRQLVPIGLVIEDKGGHVVQARFYLGMVDVLPLAGAAAVIEGGHDGQRRVHGGELVGVIGGRGHRGAVRPADDSIHHGYGR